MWAKSVSLVRGRAALGAVTGSNTDTVTFSELCATAAAAAAATAAAAAAPLQPVWIKKKP